jgi:hypothetical protein
MILVALLFLLAVAIVAFRIVMSRRSRRRATILNLIELAETFSPGLGDRLQADPAIKRLL